MKTTLRDEIYDIVEDAMYFKDKTDDVNLFVNKILLNIEKRIDEMVIEQDIWSHNEPMFRDGYIDAIAKVKEMLK
jgi:hypothetical protein